MKHSIIFKQKDYYASFPLLDQKDGILTVAFFAAPFVDHYGIHDWLITQSKDDGESWHRPRSQSIPFNWPGRSPREQSDRYTGILPGTFFMTGSTGWTLYHKKAKKKLKKAKLLVVDHPKDRKTVIVGNQSLFLSTKKAVGKHWTRREWLVPDVAYITTFPRPLKVEGGQIILLPAYAILKDGRSQNLVWRSDNGGRDWELTNMFPYNVAFGNEAAFIDVGDKMLTLIRNERYANLMESWSGDNGRTWSYPLFTSITGGPPHLLKVDGRTLLTYGYRGKGKDLSRMGIRARVSEDGRNWGREIILRDDGGTSSRLHKKKPKSGASDVGYPVSVQLENGVIFTVYYITDVRGTTHIAATKWRISESG